MTPADAAVPPHDRTRLRRLRLRLSVATQEAIRAFASEHGVSEAGLLDALFHGLETADQGWLDAVTERARTTDARYRSEGAPTSADNAPRALAASQPEPTRSGSAAGL